MSSSSYSFPSLQEKESKKNSEWHKQFIQAITNSSLGTAYSASYQVMDQCYSYFDAGSSPSEFKYLQENPDQSALPATWMSINKIRPKIKVLLGELISRGYDFKVEAINKEARVRKLEAKEEVRVAMRLQPYALELEQISGLPTSEEGLPQDEEELDEFFDKNYKEEAEIIMHFALKFLDKKNGWKTKRYELFRDLLIAGKCIVKNEIINGIPNFRRIDPRFFIHDTYAEDDFLTDSTYFGEVRYMSLSDAAVRYNLTKEELQNCFEKYSEYSRIIASKNGNHQRNQEFDGFGSIPSSSSLKWFKETSNGLRVLVLNACWTDYKNYKHKVSEDSHGGEHVKKISPDAQDREGVISKRIKIWRQGTLVGGQFLKEWGEMPNQPRDNESLADVQAPYTIVIPDFVNGRGVSVAEQQIGLQNLKDIITYNIQLAMSRAGAKGFVYDVAQCPDDWDVATVIKYLKTVGIAFINSKQGGTPAQFNQFQQIDLSLSQSVGQYLELSAWVDSEMDAISGINEARQGVVQGASQTVGVTRSALLQSSLTTAPLFALFDEFCTKVWNYQAKLVKIAFPANPERFSAIVGDSGIDFLTNDVDLELDDYAVFVDCTPALLDDLNSFQQIIMAAMQSGSLSFKDAVALLQEKDVMSGIRKYERIARQQEEAQAAQEQQMMEQQEMMKRETQLAAQAQMAKFNQMTADQAAQKAVQVQQVKDQSAIQQELLRQRGDARMAQMDALLNKRENENKSE